MAVGCAWRSPAGGVTKASAWAVAVEEGSEVVGVWACGVEGSVAAAEPAVVSNRPRSRGGSRYHSTFFFPGVVTYQTNGSHSLASSCALRCVRVYDREDFFLCSAEAVLALYFRFSGA